MSKKLNLSEDILFMAFRYALGRATYVVSEVVNTLEENWKEISFHNKELIVKEIKEHMVNKHTDMKMDKQQWERILELSLKD